ncbi:ATP-binding protein, partial [Candidatus Woesearchaeota archaeon]|nr:ATP-binding protein [Candidatus Woesearchaeota archaeon]
HYTNTITRYLKGVNKIIGVIGIRRSGKSYILRQIAKIYSDILGKENVLFVNFEEMNFPTRLDKDFLIKIIETYKEILKPKNQPLIILDEVQEVKEWERVVRSLHEKDKARIIISGSSSRVLSQELSTLLSGRLLNIEILPLSFTEFLTFKNANREEIKLNKEKRRKLFLEYLEFGGFPEIVLETDKEKKREILQNYWETIIIKDVERRFRIRKSENLDTIARFLTANPSSSINFRKMSRSLGIPLKTVERFSKYLETVRLVNFVKRFSWKIKEQEKAPRKAYLTDIAFFNLRGFKASKNYGRVFENIVAIELKRRKKEFYYYKTNDGYEVDFIVKEGNKINELIQVSAVNDKKEVNHREIRALLHAQKELNCKNLTIITDNYESIEDMEWFKIRGKIKFTPLWKWLIDNPQ